MSEVLSILLPFAVVLAVIVLLRVRSGGKLEVKTPEIVLAAVPVALWLLATGRLESLSIGDLTIKAFQTAAAVRVGQDAQALEPLAVEEVRASPKESTSRIPELLARRTQALTVRLGAGGYVASAMQSYLDELTAAPHLRWLVVEDADGRFFGLADAREVEAATRSRRLDIDELAGRLNQGSAHDREWLAGALPGFVPLADALPADATRQVALQRFERTTADALPVLDPEGRLRGMVRRDTLVAGLLADVTARLDGGS